MKNYRETLDINNKKVYDLFKKYKPESNTFIETGCHLGGGITKAINASKKFGVASPKNASVVKI